MLFIVNGAAYPGELLALMGSSGAGKTTLLNTLTFRSGRKLDVTGMRAINGEPATAETLTALSAYVQQDDLFIGTLTVREHLIFQVLKMLKIAISYEFARDLSQKATRSDPFSILVCQKNANNSFYK
jgi:ATP-binding cassette, subfamily G (WHITE), eye pigment precursor transporter